MAPKYASPGGAISAASADQLKIMYFFGEIHTNVITYLGSHFVTYTCINTVRLLVRHGVKLKTCRPTWPWVGVFQAAFPKYSDFCISPIHCHSNPYYEVSMTAGLEIRGSKCYHVLSFAAGMLKW